MVRDVEVAASPDHPMRGRYVRYMYRVRYIRYVGYVRYSMRNPTIKHDL